jgi:hypothetical protein
MAFGCKSPQSARFRTGGGSDGSDGSDGFNGSDGSNGSNGSDGSDGSDGFNGSTAALDAGDTASSARRGPRSQPKLRVSTGEVRSTLNYLPATRSNTISRCFFFF